MRLVVQRVTKAEVSVSGDVVGKIGKGLLVLIGIKKGDSEKDADMLAIKLAKLRVMADNDDKMNLSVMNVKGEILVVSQFTLHADTSSGNRPSFIRASDPAMAERLYEYFIARLKEQGIIVAKGSFGDYMKISSVLDGPVTIILES